MKCKKHPEQEAMALCEKFQVGYCHLCCDDPELPDGCMCTSPTVHCQFRTRCIVWEMSKNRRRRLLEKQD
ncbi:MAG: hypothetical protein WHX93_01375 [bacterium]